MQKSFRSVKLPVMNNVRKAASIYFTLIELLVVLEHFLRMCIICLLNLGWHHQEKDNCRAQKQSSADIEH